MTKEEIISNANELEESLRIVYGLDDDGFYRELLDDYSINIWALKSIGDSYPYDRAIEFQEKCDNIEARIPNITEEEFNEYTFYTELLAISLYEVSCLRRKNGEV